VIPIFVFMPWLDAAVADPRPGDASDPGLCPCRCKQILAWQLVKLAMLGVQRSDRYIMISIFVFMPRPDDASGPLLCPCPCKPIPA